LSRSRDGVAGPINKKELYTLHISERSFISLLILHVHVLKRLQEEDEGEKGQWKLKNDEEQDTV